jgi:predicted TIM-barrel fold metal-dependent hydrolase
MRWIDTHVHLFTQNDSDNSAIPLVYERKALNTPNLYLDILKDNKPEGIVVVDFSKAKDSEHVINSLEELKSKGIKAAGVIKANIDDERTAGWMKRSDVKGIRLYAVAGVPDLSGDKWMAVFDAVKKNGQHILVFGSGDNLLQLVAQIPHEITILVDHLGMPDILPSGVDAYTKLLEIAKNRGNIYFKGPGYRTSLDIEKVKPFVKTIVAAVGVNRLILGASDAPFAGPSPEHEGRNFNEFMDYEKVLPFISQLAVVASSDTEGVEKVLFGNAKEVYGF